MALKIFIYQLKFTNGKSYIGQTNNLNRRMGAHLRSAENNKCKQWEDPEKRKKLIKAHTKAQTLERKKKHSELMKNLWKDSKYRSRIIKSMNKKKGEKKGEKMGIYIEDPDDMDKETFLNRFGMQIGMDLRWENVPPNMLPVCLVDNGPFKAAGVAFSKRELEAFQVKDPRPKKMYLVPREAIDNMLGEEGTIRLNNFIANSN